MRDPADFDAFYVDVRERLLHQTYALTGDLPAAQAAVRDSFIGAWHHWRKVSRLPDAERWLRPVAWGHAHRRHGARIWHRDKSADPEISDTLEALGNLSFDQRKILLLATLTRGSMDDLAREAGISSEAAARELQSATSLFAAHRNITPSAIRAALQPLQAPTAEARWPRATIIRRAGTARRRTHTLVGMGALLAVMLGSGVLVTNDAGVAVSAVRPTPTAPTPTKPTKTPEPPAELTQANLLKAAQFARIAPDREWSVASTSPNVEGDGLVMPCQLGRFADPKATDALVRTYRTAAGSTPNPGAASKGPAKAQQARPVTVSAIQASEMAASTKAARRAYNVTTGWFAGCTADRVQLLSTYHVAGVGNDATLLVLRSWATPATTMVAGVARTGRVTTTTFSSSSATIDAPLSNAEVARQASLLAAAVNTLCGAPATGTCASPPTAAEIAPLPVGPVPGMISAVDLPPVMGVAESWVGTEPRQAQPHIAPTDCDNADFTRAPVTNAFTRTFLFPQADVPDTFGLSETVGTLPRRRAVAFIEDVRRRLAGCEENNPGTEVTRVANVSSDAQDLTVWNLSVEISDTQTVTYLMGIARSGTAIAQVDFTPSEQVHMGRGDFAALVARARDRLAKMPRPPVPEAPN